MKQKTLLISLATATLAVGSLHAQILSNGTGGGDWSLGTTWQGGTPPINANFQILAGDAVTATGVSISSTSSPTVVGTLNLNSGSVFSVNRVNNGSITTSGVINVNDGAQFTFNRLAAGAGGVITLNANSGSSVFGNEFNSTGAASVINVNTGGVFHTAAGTGMYTGTENLLGGTWVNNSPTGRALDTWNTGTFVSNTTNFNTSSDTNNLLNGLSSNPANTLEISSLTTAQTLSVSVAGSFSVTQGTIEMNIYSATDDDNDQIALTTAALTIDSNVTLSLGAGVSLGGVAADYLGSSYKLFDMADYSNLSATLSAETLLIGSQEYSAVWINNLSTDGTVTLDSLTVIPEPSTLLHIGMAGLAALALRRRPGGRSSRRGGLPCPSLHGRN